MLPRIALSFVWICTALWLGGMIFLFVGVQMLFRTFPKGSSNVAIEGAPALFGAFEKYQLIVAGVALLATFVWYLTTRSKLVMGIFVLLAVSGAAAAVSSGLITSKMQALRAAGQSGSPQFM